MIFGSSKPDVQHMIERKDVEGLIKALDYRKKKKSYDIPWKAAEALGNIGDSRATQPLIEALNDPKAIVFTGINGPRKMTYIRELASEALGKLGDKAVEPLIEALNDPNSQVHSGAALVLGNIGDNRAVEPLTKAVCDDKNWFVRRNAAVALGKIGDRRAVEPLREALRDANSDVRKGSAAALSKLGESEVASRPLTAVCCICGKDVTGLPVMRDQRTGLQCCESCSFNIGDPTEFIKYIDSHGLALQPDAKTTQKEYAHASEEVQRLMLRADMMRKGGKVGAYEALRDYDKALEINPQYAGAWHDKGLALLALGSYQDALAHFDMALRIENSGLKQEVIWYNKGLACAKLNLHGRAIQCLDKALEINSKYYLAKKLRGETLKKIK